MEQEDASDQPSPSTVSLSFSLNIEPWKGVDGQEIAYSFPFPSTAIISYLAWPCEGNGIGNAISCDLLVTVHPFFRSVNLLRGAEDGWRDREIVPFPSSFLHSRLYSLHYLLLSLEWERDGKDGYKRPTTAGSFLVSFSIGDAAVVQVSKPV